MPVRLQLFGGFRAFDADRELSWVSGQPVRSALLLYLSVEHEAPRNQLARIFWPNEEMERARHSLSQTLYLLRRALGEGFIQQQGDIVSLPTPPATDAAEFEAAVEAGELDRAAALYRGTFLKDAHLVDSREFEEWVDRHRARLERLHRRLRRAQIDQRVTAGDLAGGIEVARAWVTVEPFEDEAQHRLIEMLSLAGRRQEALAQFDSYEQLLRADELEPLDETKALVAELRAGRATAGDRPAIEALPVAPPPRPAAPGPREATPAAPFRRRRLPTAILLVAIVVLLAGAGTAWLLKSSGDNAERQPATPRRPVSIAVLACANLSGDPKQDYFSDGIADELLQTLSAVAGLELRSSQSSFAFKGRSDDVQAIAARLRADYVIECSLRRSGQRVRAGVRLVNGSRGGVEWSNTYERDVADVLAMEGDIARSTVAALKVRLVPDWENSLMTGGTTNPDARDAWYRGLATLAFRTPDSAAAARKHLELATRLDPSFARAWSGLADAAYWQVQAPKLRDAERSRLYGDMERFAEQALRLDSTLAEPHVSLARVASAFHGDLRLARREVDRALVLDPDSREALYTSEGLFLREGDRIRAKAGAERLLAVDPMSPTAHYMAATYINHIGEYARADSIAAEGARLDSLGYGAPEPAPKWPAYWNRGYANLLMRRYDKAAEYLPRSSEINAEPTKARATRVVLTTLAVLTRDGSLSPADRERALTVLRQNDRLLQPHVAAVIYLLLDDKAGMYAFMSAHPREIVFWPAVYDPVRNEPRFQQLMAATRKPK